MELNHEEKLVLLRNARNSIEKIFVDRELPKINYDNYPRFKQNCGAFVTLTKNEKLRGCIGYIISDWPLFETVCRAAVQAAISDTRFSPLNKEEVNQISIEISVLSVPFKMQHYDEIELGKHGLILREGIYHGVLLPQVPIEHDMTKVDYLNAICEKAGLAKEFWRQKKLNLDLFTATVFSEEEMEV